MRILITQIFPPHVGGSGKWFYEVVRREPGKYVVFSDLPDEKYNVPDVKDVIRFSFRHQNTGFFSIAGFRDYLRLMKQVSSRYRFRKGDVIVAGRMVPEGWLAVMLSYRFKLPFVCFAHGEEVNKENCMKGGVMSSRQHRWMGALVARRAKFWIANSHNTARILRNQWGVHHEKISVIHPGVDTNYFRPERTDPKFRSSMNWNERKVILTVGRLQKRKGHDQLIRVLPGIASRIPNVLYAIVGNGFERNNLELLVDELSLRNRVQFLGEVSEEKLLQCFQQCDLFLLPNRSVGSDIEGFGMVLVEAGACGKAIVAGDSGGTSETMKVGTTGFLTDPTDLSLLEKTIVDTISFVDLDQVGMQGRKFVIENFDWNIISKKIESLFQKHLF